MTVWLGSVICRTFHGLEASSQNLKWSLTLRRRCADALAFLEAAGLVVVSTNEPRVIKATDAGKTMLRRLIQKGGESGLLTKGLMRAHATAVSRGADLL